MSRLRRLRGPRTGEKASSPGTRTPACPILEHTWSECPRLPAARWTRELYAGAGGLTEALRQRGLVCRPPMESHPRPRAYVRAHDLDRDDVFLSLLSEVISGYYGYLHFATPCGQWASLSRINGSSRTLAQPDGVRPLRWKEHQSLQQVDRMCLLCLLLHTRGGIFTIENPKTSLLFRSSPVMGLSDVLPCWEVSFDQCCYGLRPLAAGPCEHIKKETKILANFAGVRALEVQCGGQSTTHQHVHAIGTRRITTEAGLRCASVASSASKCPPRLCAAVADVVRTELQRRGLHACFDNNAELLNAGSRTRRRTGPPRVVELSPSASRR